MLPIPHYCNSDSYVYVLEHVNVVYTSLDNNSTYRIISTCTLAYIVYVRMYVRNMSTYGTFHKKLDDERRSNGRSINGRTPYSRGRTPYG